MIPRGEDEFTLRVVPGVVIAFQRNETGAVAEVTLTLGDRTMVAERVE